MHLKAVLFAALVLTPLFSLIAADKELTDKTLVSWVTAANLQQRAGSILTIDDNARHFDGIVFGELSPAKWMAGSEFFLRTQKQQEAWPMETADAKTLVQMAIVYRGVTVTTYRNGVQYSQHQISQAQPFGNGSVIIIGPRHFANNQFFAGQVDDARIYDVPLSADQIVALQPNQESEIKPWAWWTFDDASVGERTGRFPQMRLTGGVKVEDGRLILNGEGGLFAASDAETADAVATSRAAPARPVPQADMVLNYHLMHPGGDSLPGDPNAAYCLDGVYHLHYILAHPWKDRTSFSFVHVTSPDMLHWTWQTTKLQPSFTGHGMFSGTGFITKDGNPAAIYHGEASGRNQIAIAKDNKLSAWEKPFPVAIRNADGTDANIHHWDPDCFLIGDTYYSISGGENPPLLKSQDLKTWTRVGNFLQNDLPDVARGEDISCPNFFRLGDKWMLLCISHDLGCRYYLGDWDAKAEQFVPQKHGRMNWRRESQSLFSRQSWRADFFAPESVLTPDGRRVMWAWCATLDRNDGAMSNYTIQSMPRELSLSADGQLRIKPLRELEGQRFDQVTLNDVSLGDPAHELRSDRSPPGKKIAQLGSDACEIRIRIARDQAERKLFGFTLFSDGKGSGLPIVFRPETGSLRVGSTEAPFAIGDLPKGEDIDLRIFVDRYVVEVFVNDRQAVIANHADYQNKLDLIGFTVGASTIIKQVDLWKIKPTNEGFFAAQKQRTWEPETK